MLRATSVRVAPAHRQGNAPDSAVWRAMLFCLDEFPERLHHLKESEWLFPQARLRCPELGPTLDRLDADHGRGKAVRRNLEHALLACEGLGDCRRQAVVAAMERYLDGCLTRMGAEEREVLPAALQHLTADDWARPRAAFAANRDPPTRRPADRPTGRHEADATFRPPFSRILMTAPAPVGRVEAAAPAWRGRDRLAPHAGGLQAAPNLPL